MKINVKRKIEPDILRTQNVLKYNVVYSGESVLKQIFHYEIMIDGLCLRI